MLHGYPGRNLLLAFLVLYALLIFNDMNMKRSDFGAKGNAGIGVQKRLRKMFA